MPVDAARQPARLRELPVAVSCGGCSAHWKDLDAAHCRACHQSWPTVEGFDDHLAGCPATPEIASRRAKRIPDQHHPSLDAAEALADLAPGQPRDEWNVA